MKRWVLTVLATAGSLVAVAGSAAAPTARAATNGDIKAACCWRFVLVVEGELTTDYSRGHSDGSSVEVWREGRYSVLWSFQRRGIRKARWVSGQSPFGLEPLNRATKDASEAIFQEESRVESVLQSGTAIKRSPVRCRRDDDFHILNTDVEADEPVSYTVRDLDVFTRLGGNPECDELGQASDVHFFNAAREMFDWKLGSKLLPVPAMVGNRAGFGRLCTFKLEASIPAARFDFRGYMTAYVRFTYFPPNRLPEWSKKLKGYLGAESFPGHVPDDLPANPFNGTDEPFRASDPDNGCHRL